MASNPFSLEGKVALVTGANTGLGQGIALALAAAGADIAAAGIVPADETGEKVKALGRRFLNIEANLISIEPVERIVAEAVAGLGGLDILVNNAGLIRRADAVDFSEKDWDDVMNVNIKSAFFMSQAAGRHFITQGRGKIINIASVQTALARPGIAPYTATKGAVGNLTKGMATDWARHGLQCNALAPGYFDTPLNAALVADPAFTEWLEKRTPAGRWGRVAELVGAAVFLSAPASSFVNGTVIYVDGGITASL